MNDEDLADKENSDWYKLQTQNKFKKTKEYDFINVNKLSFRNYKMPWWSD